jgi:hypothetical protein
MNYIISKVVKSTIICVLISSCSNRGLKNENGISFDTEKLKGKYKMDLSPFIEKKFAQNEDNSAGKNLTNGLASLAINSSFSSELNFFENNKGSFIIDTGWLGKLVGTKNESINFSYQLVDDSVLILKSKETSKLTIRKFSDSFDYIELINKEKSQKVIFTKVMEQ